MKEFVFLFTILLAVAGFAAAQESETPMQRMMKGEDGGNAGRHGHDGDDENDGTMQGHDENGSG